MAYRLRSAESYVVVQCTSIGVSCGLLQTVLSRDPWVIRLHRETENQLATHVRSAYRGAAANKSVEASSVSAAELVFGGRGCKANRRISNRYFPYE